MSVRMLSSVRRVEMNLGYDVIVRCCPLHHGLEVLVAEDSANQEYRCGFVDSCCMNAAKSQNLVSFHRRALIPLHRRMRKDATKGMVMRETLVKRAILLKTHEN